MMMKQTFAQMNQQNLTWDVGYLIVFLYNLWKSDNKLSKHNIHSFIHSLLINPHKKEKIRLH